MDTLIEDWYLVELYTDKSSEESMPLGISLLWGIVVEDLRLKFNNGNFVCSSNISERIADNLFRTKSGTIYETEGIGTQVKIHANDLPKLRAGFSPAEVLAANELGGSLVNVTHH